MNDPRSILLHRREDLVGSWSQQEVAAILDVYFAMLEMDLLDQPFNKSAMNKELAARLDGRSHKSVEYKHQNISWVLNEVGWPQVRGYRPKSNIQKLLVPAVAEYLLARPDLEAFVRAATHADSNHDIAAPVDLEHVAPPSLPAPDANWQPGLSGIRRDFLRQQEVNKSLGDAGELAVFKYEQERLASEPELAQAVDHVSVTKGDGLGFDIRSFELDGTPRLIEVKTTRYSELTPFYFSSNELNASRHYTDRYHLYRLFNFPKKAGLFVLSGALDESTHLTPLSFTAVPK